MANSEVVVVTGASSGIGRAIARRFGQDGARIGLIARGRDGLQGASEEIERAGGQPLVVPTDLADWDAVSSAAQVVEEAFGPIDIWINNAMATIFAPFSEIGADEFRRATEVTYLGTVWGTKAALERMRPRDRGTIVIVGSALAYRGIPLQAAYCGAKHGVKGVFESLRAFTIKLVIMLVLSRHDLGKRALRITAFQRVRRCQLVPQTTASARRLALRIPLCR